MPKSSIAYIDISFFAHATEDPEKVMKAAENVFSTVHAEKISFKRSKLKGGYGNPLIYFKTRIEEGTLAESVLKHVSSQLSTQEKERLSQELSLHLEKGSLYIRFDKQAAFMGDLRFCMEDPIHMRIRFRKGKIEEVVKACREIGLLPEPHI